jgi:hypothetical protein
MRLAAWTSFFAAGARACCEAIPAQVLVHSNRVVVQDEHAQARAAGIDTCTLAQYTDNYLPPAVELEQIEIL